MLFIVSSNVNKVDSVTRKKIRSHVMRGKKQKKVRFDDDTRTTNWMSVTGPIEAVSIKLEEVIQAWNSSVPNRVGSDISFLDLADDIEPLLVLKLIKFSPIATKIISPLQTATGLQPPDNTTLYPVSTDAAALHITLFAVEGFFDRILREKENYSQTALLHRQKGLRILRERLLRKEDETTLSDATISVVVKLASTAHFDGDYEVAKQHMEGLRRMVDLRGGLDGFRGRGYFSEMFRCDLSIALLNGSRPIFFNSPAEAVPEYPERLVSDPSSPQDVSEFLENLDTELATAWRVMRRFCLLVNLGRQIQRPFNPDTIHETMIAAMYRLLHMEYAAGSNDEIVRLVLLAFCYHVFLQWQDIRPPRGHFVIAYKNCIRGLEQHDEISALLGLWLTMIGAVSLFDISKEAWLVEILREYSHRCEVKTWKEMQEILKSFMWIGLLDDQPGEQISSSVLLDIEKS